jgi:cystathionine beta-lyase/cystathionine gamma-synthase
VESPSRGERRRAVSTRAIHGPMRQVVSEASGSPLSIPLIQSSAFSFDCPEEMIEVLDGRRSGFVYTRYGNPTIQAVEEKLAAIEEGEFCRLFASGMAAIHAATWSCLQKGDLLLTAHDLYGGTNELLSSILPRLGVSWKRIDMASLSDFERALSDKPAIVYFETPTNPLLRVVDGPGVVRRAREAGAKVIVDSTFATPILQNPLSWGVDLVVHSATKYLGGHSDLTLGAVIGREGDEKGIDTARRSLGAGPDPFAAWLLNRGLATLAVRVRAQCDAAAVLARALDGREGIEKVHYPGLPGHPGHAIAVGQMRAPGGVLAIELAGGREGALRFMKGLRTIRLGATLGGIESLATHPATSSHGMISPRERDAMGIREGLVRISVGLEDVDDLLDDIDRALRGSGDVSS